MESERKKEKATKGMAASKSNRIESNRVELSRVGLIRIESSQTKGNQTERNRTKCVLFAQCALFLGLLCVSQACIFSTFSQFAFGSQIARSSSLMGNNELGSSCADYCASFLRTSAHKRATTALTYQCNQS